jgi:hypothetical protein
MKKLILSFAVLLGGSAFAQLPAGSIAPDFTFTDLNGTSHRLYDYLDQGKTVVLDVSCAWCGPCWNYHTSHELAHFYEAHGPAGFAGVEAGTSDDMMVFLIEAEQTNTVAQIMGVNAPGGGYSGFTTGDWTEGTPYPIIDIPSDQSGDDFLSGYYIDHFPMIYVICPNRSIVLKYAMPAANLYTVAQNFCPDPASSSADVAAAYAGASHCEGDYTPVVRIQNNSTQPLTSATITISVGGNVVSTASWTGNLETYAFDSVACSVIPGFAGGTLNITVTTDDDTNPANGTASAFVGAIATTNVIHVAVSTDLTPDESSWKILDNNGQVVAGTESPDLAENQMQSFSYTLPGPGCYTFVMEDAEGNGIFNGSTQTETVDGSLMVSDSEGAVIMDDIDFGFGRSVPFKVQETMGIPNNPIEGLSVYPNPASGLLHISFTGEAASTVTLADLTGRIVFESSPASVSNEQQLDIPVDGFQQGSYLLTVRSGDSRSVRKIAVN